MPALYPALLLPAGAKVSKNPAASPKTNDENRTQEQTCLRNSLTVGQHSYLLRVCCHVLGNDSFVFCLIFSVFRVKAGVATVAP